MEEQKNDRLFGLLGKNISYSFSQHYFLDKFKKENILGASYQNFDVPSNKEFPKVLTEKNLRGLNVTIPYKEAIIPFLDDLDAVAKSVGAVNTIQIKNGKAKGFNTDVIGFQKSIEPLLQKQHTKALILGTGGASKAVEYVLNSLKIKCKKVSRKPSSNEFSYQEITANLLSNFTILINCTPLGTFPKVEDCPDLPYQYITQNHLLYDLIYNPKATLFLQKGQQQGAAIKNGLEMLELQAEASWQLWNS